MSDNALLFREFDKFAQLETIDKETLSEDDIVIFSGHNPDFHPEIGPGWWEDSPNIVTVSYTHLTLPTNREV